MKRKGYLLRSFYFWYKITQKGQSVLYLSVVANKKIHLASRNRKSKNQMLQMYEAFKLMYL